ncbi:uncharacterized protein PHALS_06682 [Plasmopara halstedii]|uniref:Uncharacterized protein n=1 Tax=Plasmopara halstedii TaxID=4781 RepID=A0A0P1B4E6_PLAHL|nr:uncharacterized protein PHALS_06682 [Plasmopara halstedii]CEG48887.1 hypothetical protein PHALS_06682 [Plasmopara halstedii]|eukprot:XP_024585256.1 hypothetical protein PHALS_06682 [Plasmopara halstedii]
MRLRLRAPDESEGERNNYPNTGDNIALPSLNSNPLLPPLDVGSPEYIEERLENLKRRPNWRDFLDQYVQEHPDSESEDNCSEDTAYADSSNLFHSTLWSLLVVTFTPLFILCAPLLKHKRYGFWPLGCHSMKELFCCALVNVIFMVFGFVTLYWTICRELPKKFDVNENYIKINAQIIEVQSAAMTCHAALLQWESTVALELCVPVVIDAVLLVLNLWLLLNYYRRPAKYLMVLMAAMYMIDVPARLYDLTFPAPKIFRVDPTFAMINEELIVALDGVNLKPNGSVAWVAYWGCATTSNVDVCEKQFISVYDAGTVAVTFRSFDYFIPCYRNPPDPLKAQDFQCFEDVRIRVKHSRSIPGLPRSVSGASNSRLVQAGLSLRGEKEGNATTKKMITHDVMTATVKPTQIEPTNDAAIDVSKDLKLALGFIKNVDLIEEEKHISEVGIGPRMDAEDGTESAQSGNDKKLEEVDVTSDAKAKMCHIDVEGGTTSQTCVPAGCLESLQDPESKIDGFLHALKDALTEVEVDTENTHTAVDRDEEGKDDAFQIVVDALASKEVAVVDMAVVLEKERVHMADRNQKGIVVEINMRDIGELSTSAAIATDEKLEEAGLRHEIGSAFQDKGIQAKLRDATIDKIKVEEVSKQKKDLKRKKIRPFEKGSAITDA